MIYIPSLDLVFPEWVSPVTRQYLLQVAGGTEDVPHRDGGYRETPEWLTDAVSLAASDWWRSPKHTY